MLIWNGNDKLFQSLALGMEMPEMESVLKDEINFKEILRMVDENQNYEFQDNPSCSLVSSCHKGSEIKDYLLSYEVQGSVGVLNDLALETSYTHKELSSRRHEALAFVMTVEAKKGCLSAGCQETAKPKQLLPNGRTRGASAIVDRVEVGISETLIVTLKYGVEESKVQNAVSFTINAVFFTISGKLESVVSRSTISGSIWIQHYSSLSSGWETQSLSAEKYSTALDVIKTLEERMVTLPALVARSSPSELSCLGYNLKIPSKEMNSSLLLELEELNHYLQVTRRHTREIEVAESFVQNLTSPEGTEFLSVLKNKAVRFRNLEQDLKALILESNKLKIAREVDTFEKRIEVVYGPYLPNHYIKEAERFLT